ncbi:MAG: hypothetical protein QM736_25880 [Vicinamibacterales bacterium]
MASMLSNRLAFLALAAACVAAAAGGSYLATRHNVADRQTVVEAAGAGTTGLADSGSVTKPVDDTAVVNAPVTPPVATNAAPAAKATAIKSQPTRATQPVRGTAPATATQPRVDTPAAISDHLPTLPSTAAPVETAPVIARDDRPVEAPVVLDPPKPTFEELTVAADSVIGLQTETTLSSERARVEDRVEARVVRDVRVGGRVAIPAGSHALGSVVVVERGGRARNRARLGIRFHTLALADGTRIPISTETIYRFGDDPTNSSAAKIGGGAVAGAILGAIIGGGRGAAIGATTGAAGGGAAVMASDRSEAVFPSGAQITARIVSPLTVTVDR